MDSMDSVLERAYDLRDTITRWYEDLHRIPELDQALPQTRAYVTAALEEMGIPYDTFQSSSSVCAVLTGGRPGKAVALRADMDALHIQEQTGLPYASSNGNMHACGHDAHTAMLLGAARLLRDQRDRLPGTVKFFFQAGEEGSGGAEDMIANGVMKDPDVGAVFGQHVGTMSAELPSGKFGFFPGKFMASRDSFFITVLGKGCHGSQPSQGVDPVVISAELILALQTLVSRESSVNDPGVLTIGAIHGGEVYNVIPDKVVLNGAIRCFSEEKRQYFERRIRETCENICAAMRGSCVIEYEHGYPVTVNDPSMTRFAMDSAARLLGKDAVQQLQYPLPGSEDVSFFLQEVPGCYWVLTTTPEGQTAYPNHSPRFVLDEGMLHKGAALLAGVAGDWLSARA